MKVIITDNFLRFAAGYDTDRGYLPRGQKGQGAYICLQDSGGPDSQREIKSRWNKKKSKKKKLEKEEMPKESM